MKGMKEMFIILSLIVESSVSFFFPFVLHLIGIVGGIAEGKS